MRRLFHKLYGALILAVVVSVCSGAITAALLHDKPPMRNIDHATIFRVAQALEKDDAQLKEAVEALAINEGVAVAVFDQSKKIRVASGGTTPRPEEAGDHWLWDRALGKGGFAFGLPQGGWLVIAGPPRSLLKTVQDLFTVLLVIGVVLALAAFPIARHLTWRLESLKLGVETLGEGNLTARVEVRGGDEVAQLARSFNRAAERIEALVDSQRRMLASASHELRSPLARIRMALELISDESSGDRAKQLGEGVQKDIEELDELIDDVLLASRLQSGGLPKQKDTVNLLAIAREEAERVNAQITGEAEIVGDERMMRRLIRNLLENAVRYGAPPIVVHLSPKTLEVIDHGPGIAADEQDRIFEPFYRPRGHAETRDGGVGLGLSLVRDIAAHLGAEVSCTSDGDETRFIVKW